MVGPTDFATVQWARKMTTLAQNFSDLSPNDLHKMNEFLDKLALYRQAGEELTESQLQVIMQTLHTKELVKMETVKGGVWLEFTGGGFAYERFLIRPDGKVPNSRYETKRAE